MRLLPFFVAPLLGVLALGTVVMAAPPAGAETLHVVGAGSLTAAFTELLQRFPPEGDSIAAPVFGPSGVMRQKIEAGLAADVFASADMDQPRRLVAGHPEDMVVLFTRNRLCALARAAIGLTPDNMLDRLLDPALRLATSTPGADPGGDYAWAMFARAEGVHPGARAILEGKARKLVGGPDTPLLVPGQGAVEGVFLADRADVMLGYCSGSAAVMRGVPGLVSVPLPPALTVGPAYGMAVGPSPVAWRFALFVMSELGQSVLGAYGFDPVALASPASRGAPEGKSP
jgi:ABC-type molybdate transport system substrate-binding protein